MTAPRAELVIRVTAEGKIQVGGPIHDKMLCYGLLEMARDAINEHVANMQRPPIVSARVADPMLIDPRRNGGGKAS